MTKEQNQQGRHWASTSTASIWILWILNHIATFDLVIRVRPIVNIQVLFSVNFVSFKTSQNLEILAKICCHFECLQYEEDEYSNDGRCSSLLKYLPKWQKVLMIFAVNQQTAFVNVLLTVGRIEWLMIVALIWSSSPLLCSLECWN